MPMVMVMACSQSHSVTLTLSDRHSYMASSNTAITLDTEYYLPVELVAQNKS